MKWYPAEDVVGKKAVARKQNPTKIRSSIQPGTVLILLSGRFRGKRVIFLKSLASGCLLVTGPYQVNGVPLRRVNQAYVIATSTKVDVSGVKLTGIDDAYFARDASGASAEEEEFFNNSAPQPAIVSDKRKADQKAVDTPLMAALQKDKMLKAYLNAKFSLKKGDRPHEMKF